MMLARFSTKRKATASPCTVSGTLNGSAATATVVGASATVTVPAGNSGTLEIRNVATSGGVFGWRKNADAYVTEATQLTFVSSDTVNVRGTGMTSPETITAELWDVTTNTKITDISISRT